MHCYEECGSLLTLSFKHVLDSTKESITPVMLHVSSSPTLMETARNTTTWGKKRGKGKGKKRKGREVETRKRRKNEKNEQINKKLWVWKEKRRRW